MRLLWVKRAKQKVNFSQIRKYTCAALWSWTDFAMVIVFESKKSRNWWPQKFQFSEGFWSLPACGMKLNKRNVRALKKRKRGEEIDKEHSLPGLSLELYLQFCGRGRKEWRWERVGGGGGVGVGVGSGWEIGVGGVGSGQERGLGYRRRAYERQKLEISNLSQPLLNLALNFSPWAKGASTSEPSIQGKTIPDRWIYVRIQKLLHFIK